MFDWSSTWQKVTRENQRARRSWPRPPPVLWRAVVGKFVHPQRAICGCQACAARARQNGLSGPSGTFLAVSRCSSLGRFAARVGLWHLRRFRGPLHAVGGGLLPRGVCVGGGRRAFWRCFAGAIFWSERWSGSQSACAVAGAGARARPGGGLPTLSEPVAEPSGLGRRHSAPACVERSTSWWRTARVSWEFCGSSPACTPVLTVSGGGQECGAAPRAAGSPRAVCPGRGERPLRVA